MKKMLKISAQNRLFFFITLIVLILGILFGNIVNQAMVANSNAEELDPVVNASKQPEGDADANDSTEISKSETEETIYLLQLGVFESWDNALALSNDIKRLGHEYVLVKDSKNQFIMYSHIVGDSTQLDDIKKDLESEGISSFAKAIEVDVEDEKWNYFLQAVKEKPYEMSADFIQTFTNEDLYIFGYFTTLSNASFEPLSKERQVMLLDIYYWLLEG